MKKKVIDFNRLPKQEYLKPEITVGDMDLDALLLAVSVQTTGLGDDNLSSDATPGDAWNDAMSRRSNAWSDEGDEEW